MEEPNGTSRMPVRCSAPPMLNIFVPGSDSVPNSRYQSAPCSSAGGTCA